MGILLKTLTEKKTLLFALKIVGECTKLRYFHSITSLRTSILYVSEQHISVKIPPLHVNGIQSISAAKVQTHFIRKIYPVSISFLEEAVFLISAWGMSSTLK